MYKADDLYQLGIPRNREILGLALKGANKAISDGLDENLLRELIKNMALSENPDKTDLGKASLYLSEVAAKLADARKTNALFFERKEPAPWKSWADETVEDSAVSQMVNACRLPISYGGALMPDAHTGYGLPIGGVLAVENAVIPYAVGVDIACRMRISVLDIPYEEYEKRKSDLTAALEKQTMFGVGVYFDKNSRLEHSVMEHHTWNEIRILKDFFARAHSQLGTSGSGNHFVEFGKLTVDKDIDEPSFKIKAGTYLALLSHSGSRGSGEAVAKHYSSVAMSYHPELPQELKHLAWLSMDSGEGQEYWEAMQLMGLYASANHELIHKRVIEYLGCSTFGFVENHHNFAWKEMYDNKELIIHRKGATPAGLGVLGVIPGSMGSSGFIVRGKGNPASFSSCSHGAGRLMSRKAAFKTLSSENMLSLLRDKGITLLSGELNESPKVYKDIEKVMTSQQDLVDILASFDPKLVKMAGPRF